MSSAPIQGPGEYLGDDAGGAHLVLLTDRSHLVLSGEVDARLPARVRFLAPTPQVRFLLQLTQLEEIVDIVEPAATPSPAGPAPGSPTTGPGLLDPA